MHYHILQSYCTWNHSKLYDKIYLEINTVFQIKHVHEHESDQNTWDLKWNCVFMKYPNIKPNASVEIVSNMQTNIWLQFNMCLMIELSKWNFISSCNASPFYSFALNRISSFQAVCQINLIRDYDSMIKWNWTTNCIDTCVRWFSTVLSNRHFRRTKMTEIYKNKRVCSQWEFTSIAINRGSLLPIEHCLWYLKRSIWRIGAIKSTISLFI